MQRKITDAWPEKAEYTKSWEGLVVRRVIGTGTSSKIDWILARKQARW
jgi:hypothetical protein